MGKLGFDIAPAQNVKTQAVSDSSKAAASTEFVHSVVCCGDVTMYAGAVPPVGWLMCDGSAVLRATYPRLFAVIGVTYGAGNGTTTFNLPDLRGEFVRGLDNGRGVDPGRTLGSSQVNMIQSHAHSTIGTIAAASGSAYGVPGSGASRWDTTFEGGSETRPRNVAMNFKIKAF